MAYNGAAYHGWQVQPNAITVQELVDDALWKATRDKLHVVGCGRTDTGVHASYFVAHFNSETEIKDTTQLTYKLNRILPRDISIFSVQQVDCELHSRFSALSRTYHYHLTEVKNPFLLEFSYRPPYALDFELMNKAAQSLFKYTDFTSFSRLHTDVKTNNCKIYEARWEYVNCNWVFVIKADRFLRNMVRAIVGTLLEVGRGKLPIEGFEAVIEAQNRSKAGSSAPGNGLFLVDIEYPEGSFQLNKPLSI